MYEKGINMEFIDYKLFINFKDQQIQIKDVPKNYDYYEFIKNNINNDCEQIVVSSDIMISFLKEQFSKNKAKIISLDFLEEDEEYCSHLKDLIQLVNNNRENFYLLTDELSFLEENKTVEIKYIRIGFNRNSHPVDISLYINGKITSSDNKETYEELELISSWLWEQMKEWI